MNGEPASWGDKKKGERDFNIQANGGKKEDVVANQSKASKKISIQTLREREVYRRRALVYTYKCITSRKVQ